MVLRDTKTFMVLESQPPLSTSVNHQVYLWTWPFPLIGNKFLKSNNHIYRVSSTKKKAQQRYFILLILPHLSVFLEQMFNTHLNGLSQKFCENDLLA